MTEMKKDRPLSEFEQWREWLSSHHGRYISWNSMQREFAKMRANRLAVAFSWSAGWNDFLPKAASRFACRRTP
jgi:hypothetical protein